MITKELVEQWAMDNAIVASNAYRASRHDLDCMYKAWPEELLAFAQRAAAYGAEQRESELMAGGVKPADVYYVEGTKYIRYSAEQLAAARLRGAEEADGRAATAVTQFRYLAKDQAVKHQTILDLKRVNQGLLDALKKIARVNAMDYEYQRWARAAIAAAEQEKTK